jgi:uncharacterized membrane protein HdeD (DUF308 family)
MAQATRSDPQDMIGALGRSWGWILFFGIVSIVAGALVIARPGGAVVGVAILFGSWLFVSGIFRIVEAIADREDSGGVRVLIAVWGILSLLIGLFMLRHIFQTIQIIAFLIGIFWIAGGTIEFIAAVSHKGMEGRGWRIFMGILGVVAGVIVLASPGISLLTLAWVMGIWFVVYGVMESVLAFQIRKLRAA